MVRLTKAEQTGDMALAEDVMPVLELSSELGQYLQQAKTLLRKVQAAEAEKELEQIHGRLFTKDPESVTLDELKNLESAASKVDEGCKLNLGPRVHDMLHIVMLIGKAGGHDACNMELALDFIHATQKAKRLGMCFHTLQAVIL